MALQEQNKLEQSNTIDMRFTKSSNPIFNSASYEQNSMSVAGSDVMTVSGTVNKTIILALLVFAGAFYTWFNPSSILMWTGAIGGLITALITTFKPKFSGVTAPIYAVLEGLFLGGISQLFAGMYDGIVFQAISLTIGVLFMMLFFYRSGIIKVTEKLKMGVAAATGGIFLMYMVNFIVGFFGTPFLSIANTSMFSIGISLLIVGVAAFNLLLDFDFIEKGAQQGAPKYMEWFGAFGLMVTLVWLYLELLKLLAKLASRD